MPSTTLSAQIHLELQADTDDDDISVSCCALEGNAVKLVADEIKTTSVCECGAKEKQLETDIKNVVSEFVSRVCEGLTDPEGPSAEVAESSGGMDASLEAPEIRPTESTNGWMNTIGTFFKRLFWRDPAVPEPVCVPGPSSSEPEPELDLVDPESVKKKKMHKICAFFKKLFGKDPTVPEPLCVPDASTPEPEPELDLDAIEQSSVPVPSIPELEPDLDLFDSDESSCDLVPMVLELEHNLDLFDSDESCVPGPSSAVPRPKASTSKQHPCFQLEERVKACRMRYKPVTQVWNNIFIGNKETARDRMRMKELGITHILNAAAMKKKLRILLGIVWEKDVKDTVDTGASYYRGMKIHYYKVFIYCTDGDSYAPTLFLAYLMIHQNMSVEDAIDYLVKVKYIEPDIDFLRQLAILNEELVHE
ncbi:Dual specificity phosphatase DUPD1 [Anabarilius grahami]|uniref:Dual specificity phosphatase DUPD1 n=1 Tax=Anabarilius grahami TaxID=495550 RepID=A0A3N0XSL0_ANAGA|nr:Dual specificity phosphatase DUPD1 [Anabarilius grahami]